MSFTTKSVILDIADAHGDDTLLGFRSIDFWYEGSKITNIETTDFVAYVTSQFSNYNPGDSFDTSDPKTGAGLGRQWYSAVSSITNQRLICVFNSETTFDEIRINNSHESGGDTNRGINNVKINISTDAITDTTYDASISNSTLIYDGTFDEHIASDVEDEQILVIISPEEEYTPPNSTEIEFVIASGYTPPDNEAIDFVMEYVSPPVSVSGIITEEGDPVVRTVRAYDRGTGALIAETMSYIIDGSYTIETGSSTEIFVIAFDDDAGTAYNAVILDKIIPN